MHRGQSTYPFSAHLKRVGDWKTYLYSVLADNAWRETSETLSVMHPRKR